MNSKVVAAWPAKPYLVLLLLSLSVGRGRAEDNPSPEPEPSQRFTLHHAGATLPVAAYLEPRTRRGFITIGEGGARFTSLVYGLWKVMLADLDGDGEEEILFGVWSRRPRHAEPEPHRTIWVMSWNGVQVVPRYRGSALSRPLRDAVTAALDAEAGEELLALERTSTACWLTAYRWNGFGFSGVGRARVACGSSFTPHAGCIVDKGRERCAKLLHRKLLLP